MSCARLTKNSRNLVVATAGDEHINAVAAIIHNPKCASGSGTLSASKTQLQSKPCSKA